MTPRVRQVALLLLVAALAALLLLSTSLSDLHLRTGSPFPGASGGAPASAPGTGTSGSSGSAALVEAVLGVLLLLFLIYLPTRLVKLVSLRNIVWLALGFLLLVVLLSLMPRVLPGPPVLQSDGSATAATPPSFAYPVSPLGEPPSGLLWLTAAGLLLAVAILAVLLFRQASKPTLAADALSQEAEKALHDLQAGRAFEDVIIRCYLQMTDVLRKEQKLERRESMTAHEFEEWLEAKGIPAAPVRRLTSLFETVRYGSGALDQRDEQAGTESLQQIVQYCRAGSGVK